MSGNLAPPPQYALRCASQVLTSRGARILHNGQPLGANCTSRFLTPPEPRTRRERGAGSNTPSPPSPPVPSRELRELQVARIARAVDAAAAAGKPRAGCLLVLRPRAGGSGSGSGVHAWEALTVSRKHDGADIGLPAGKANDGEPPSLAAVREMAEETGYVLEPPSDYLLVPLLAADGDSGTDMVTSCVAVTYLALGPPLPPHPPAPPAKGETGRVAWLPLERALSSSKSFAVYNARVAAIVRVALPLLLSAAPAPAAIDNSMAASLAPIIDAALALPACGSAAAISAVDRLAART